jgi:hypothetical protein
MNSTLAADDDVYNSKFNLKNYVSCLTKLNGAICEEDDHDNAVVYQHCDGLLCVLCRKYTK